MDRFQDLVGAYALDALDEDERRAFESHVLECESCREELRAYRESVASLAYAAPLAEPPAALRERILQAARAELAPPAPAWWRRVRLPRLALALPVTAAAAAAAIVLAFVLGHGSGTSWVRTATDRVALSGGKGEVVVSGTRGALVLRSLVDAPAGHVYEAWVMRRNRPIPAGTFHSASGPVVLTVPVRHGDVVAVTVEPGSGSTAPTTKPILSATV